MRLEKGDRRLPIELCTATNSDGMQCHLRMGHGHAHQIFDGRNEITCMWPINSSERLYHGVKSTKIPRFELIPKSALEALALRFELGIERKGDGAWNALTKHKEEALQDTAFVIERLSHCILHCYDAIGKLASGEMEGEEDAGAIMFAGAVLAEWKRLSVNKA